MECSIKNCPRSPEREQKNEKFESHKRQRLGELVVIYREVIIEKTGEKDKNQESFSEFYVDFKKRKSWLIQENSQALSVDKSEEECHFVTLESNERDSSPQNSPISEKEIQNEESPFHNENSELIQNEGEENESELEELSENLPPRFSSLIPVEIGLKIKRLSERL